MAKAKPVFSFDHNVGFEPNLAILGEFLTELDANLGPVLNAAIPALLRESYDIGQILDDLFAKTAPVIETGAPENTADGLTPTVAPSTGASPTSSPSAAVPAVTGWLLEGVSIEGFRGINNEGRPLELKFKPDKINSISAVNGVGKSSIYDAIRYAITGELAWLDGLPASERDKDYYLNRFHSGQTGTVKLRLLAEPTGAKCEITVIRSSGGSRTVTATNGMNGPEILRGLNREFVLLDGPTFNSFIASKPLERGRTFSGLLGLSEYSRLRQALEAVARTRTFNEHFSVTAHEGAKAREERLAAEAQAVVANDYEILVGQALKATDSDAAQSMCHAALAQIPTLADQCAGKTFDGIDINACVEEIKAAEGGPKRERLAECIRERTELKRLNLEAPDAISAPNLVIRARERDDAIAKTAGKLMFDLYTAGQSALLDLGAGNTHHCPLCDSDTPHDMHAHVAEKLAEFAALDDAVKALALEWNGSGWHELQPLEQALEVDGSARLIGLMRQRGENGQLATAEAEALVAWLTTLRSRAAEKDGLLLAEQEVLEKELPPSSVELTTKVEAARRLQENWKRLKGHQDAAKEEVERAKRLSHIKTFLNTAASAFGAAETAMSKARLTAVEPIFQDFFKRMSFFGVVPSVAKRANSEDLQLRLAQFLTLSDLSPQALLSESYRNAFAISLYLAAASRFGGMPKFIVLDDVTSSFDAGHPYYLVELLRLGFARPGKADGLQVILLSHDTMLEKLFNKHSNTGVWLHQRLEGTPQVGVFPQAGAVNKVRDHTISMLQAGQVDFAKEGVRQYLEYRLSDLISRLRIPVPVDVAFNDNKQLSGDFLGAIDAAVKLHNAAGSLILNNTQVVGLNANMVTIVGNFLSHWGTGQATAFSANALLGVMQAIDDYCNCFTYEPTPGADRVFYKSLSQVS